MADKIRILVDLDEVLADFVGSALRLHGVAVETFQRRQPAGTWDMTIGLDLSPEAFWSPINSMGERFWANLPKLPWANQLISLISGITDDWHIVSSPSRCPTSYNGKVRWLKKEFGEGFDRFALTPHKYIFAKPGVILIDDRDQNIDDFVAAGGEGIVFPTHLNTNHLFKNDPLTFIKSRLSCI